MQLTDGDEKCALKLCVYKTPFDKSGHIYAYKLQLCLLYVFFSYSYMPTCL